MNTKPSAELDLVPWVRLHLATVYHAGASRAILERCATPAGVFSAPRSALRDLPGVTPAVIEKLFAGDSERRAREEIRRAASEGVRLIAACAPEFPLAWSALPGMPCLLYVRGSSSFPPESVAVVGSRRPTPYGLAQARRFSAGLARRGLAVVSGLALGIDGEAHRAALDERGATIAVLGSGLGRVYPPEHRDLARRIAESPGGAVVSELPLDAPPRSFHFPMRNRLLSGLAAAVLVVEASEKSGSLITVSHALDQGKPVYSVPGRVDRPESMGCLRLLLDGAAPAIGPDDVLPGGGTAPQRRRTAGAAPAPLGGRFGPRLDALFEEEDAWHPDAIAERIGAPPRDVLAELSRLELDGQLQRLPGGAYGRGT